MGPPRALARTQKLSYEIGPKYTEQSTGKIKHFFLRLPSFTSSRGAVDRQRVAVASSASCCCCLLLVQRTSWCVLVARPRKVEKSLLRAQHGESDNWSNALATITHTHGLSPRARSLRQVDCALTG